MSSFTAAGLRIEACAEPRLPAATGAEAAGVPEAELVAGLPGVIAWAARRP